MNKKERPWLFVVFPTIAMLLGWGLRGYIGGGPFGAMIPGAMVALCISMLLILPVRKALRPYCLLYICFDRFDDIF